MFTKRQIALLMTLLVVTALTCVSLTADPVTLTKEDWTEFSDFQRVGMLVVDSFGETTLTIQGLRITEETMTAVYKDGRAFLDTIEKHFPNRETLLIRVSPVGNEYFWPSNFTFTQGNQQYSVSPYEDRAKISDMFSGGKLREGTVHYGVVAIPQPIDVLQPFKLWYNETSDALQFR